jgi:hypothetical protein
MRACTVIPSPLLPPPPLALPKRGWGDACAPSSALARGLRRVRARALAVRTEGVCDAPPPLRITREERARGRQRGREARGGRSASPLAPPPSLAPADTRRLVADLFCSRASKPDQARQGEGWCGCRSRERGLFHPGSLFFRAQATLALPAPLRARLVCLAPAPKDFYVRALRKRARHLLHNNHPAPYFPSPLVCSCRARPTSKAVDDAQLQVLMPSPASKPACNVSFFSPVSFSFLLVLTATGDCLRKRPLEPPSGSTAATRPPPGRDTSHMQTPARPALLYAPSR